VIQSRKPPTESLENLDLNKGESSEDEEDLRQREREMEERKEKAKKEREEKMRKYDERRQELFGTTTGSTSGSGNANGKPKSGTSTPQSLTPPGSRSSTPNRGRGRGRGRGNGGAQQRQRQGELFEPGYAAKPDSVFLQRRENVAGTTREDVQLPIRTPKGPDGTGRGGFGFSARGGKQAGSIPTPAVESPT
jgi:hypothetical protein